MKLFSLTKQVLLTLYVLFFANTVFSCSMYKVTANGKTMVGNNEDSWRRDAAIWFEPAKNGNFGLVCVGYKGKKHPDGAMNEHGLTYDAFSMLHKPNMPPRNPKKKDFAYSQLKSLMQHCKTVDEVYNKLKEMNLQVLNGSTLFNGGMLLFVDKSGKYLVVEARKMTLGDDAKFPLANFSVADTKSAHSIQLERYRKGVAFLSNKPLASTLSFCEKLSDTMSVNRKKVGDGTLYTSIYDLEKGIVHLYFFHDFQQRVSFNLKEELKKGRHSYVMAELFPKNSNYERFLNYKTPQNNQAIFLFLIACGGLFLFSSLYYLVRFIKTFSTHKSLFKLSLSIFSLAFAIYSYVLLRNESIYYFPSPYTDAQSVIVSVSSYLPFVLLLFITPMVLQMILLYKRQSESRTTLVLMALNNCAYFVLIGLFAYWKLFGTFDGSY